CPLEADSPITYIQDRGLGVAVKELALPLAANSDLSHHTTSKLVGTPTCWPVDSDSESTDSMFSIATAVTSGGVTCGVNPVYSQNLSMARWASARRCPAALAAMAAVSAAGAAAAGTGLAAEAATAALTAAAAAATAAAEAVA